MNLPSTTFAAALRELGSSGLAVAALRERSIGAALAAYGAAAQPARQADDFVEDVSDGLFLGMLDHE